MTSRRVIYYILAAFIAGNLLLIYLQYNSSKNINTLINENEKLLSEWKTGTELEELERDVASFENRMRDAISTNDTSHILTLEKRLVEFEGNMDNLIASTGDDSSAVYIHLLDSLVRQKTRFSRDVLQTFRHNGKQASERLISDKRIKEINGQITITAHSLSERRQQIVGLLNDAIDESARNARKWGTVLIIIVLVVTSTVFWFIINRITIQNQLIAELDASEKKVREAALVKENFMTNMSHEIRTPMNAILGFTNLLSRKPLDTESREYISTIRKSGENLLNIIDDILDLAKIEAGMMPIQSVPFSIREIAATVETLFREKAREKKLNLSTSVEANVPDTLEGDPTRLIQILVNLIGNSIKFTEKGSVALHISIHRLGPADTELLIEIKDTGIGIEKEKLSSIFERFNQAEDSITRKYGGTGLGLSIVHDLVQLHKGTISVDSQKGNGTVFRIILPYGIAAQQTAPEQLETQPVLESFHEPVHVLVVEDNEINQNLLRHLFREWNISYQMSSNGKEALENLKNNTYDMILMDIQMPAMDGYTATTHIRQDLKLDTPVIAMTAHAAPAEQEKCLSHGMDAYLPKPVREKELYNIIARFVPSKKISGKTTKSAGGTDIAYTYINLDYMKEVGGGNRDYEKTVTEQFLEMIPDDLEKLSNAIDNEDWHRLARTAHNMRTSVSVMGLVDRLSPYLDTLETSQEETQILKAFSSVKEIIFCSLEEARNYYEAIA
jgi:signal transduction histidine kinase/FixJ family two-component response regulator/HPt (histidine-containing phosphotransfer) domain-containing protein